MQEFTSSDFASLRIIQFQALHKNLYSWMRCFFSFIYLFIYLFFLLIVFSLSLYFLFENGIDPVFNFIMLHYLCIEMRVLHAL